ncbi:MAG: PAS domain S-box protein [Bacteroidota bacterium]
MDKKSEAIGKDKHRPDSSAEIKDGMPASLYEHLLQSVQDGIIVTDRKERIIFVNKVVERISGLNAAQLMNRNLLRDFDRKVLKEFAPSYRASRSDLQERSFTARVITPVGRRAIQEFRLIPRVREERYDGMICTIIDQTEKLIAEEALQESRRFLQNIIEHSREMHYVHDTRNVITFVSPQCRQILGYSPDELMNIRWTSLATRNELNREAALYTKRALETGKKQPLYPLELKRKDGRPIWVEVAESPLVDENGKVVGIVGSLYDITKRRNNQETIRLERDRAQTYFDLAGNFFLVLDREGRVDIMNRRGQEILGYTASELKGVVWTGKFVPRGERQDLKKRLADLKKNEQGTITAFEGRVITRKRAQRLILWRITLIRDPKSRNISFLFNGMDITERKAAEQELLRKSEIIEQQNRKYQQVNRELKNTLKELKESNKKLEEARTRAEESDKLKSAFLANMSHEIRTPMNSIMGFSDLLMNDSIPPEDARKYLSLVRRSSEYLLRIINDILDISRIESGSLEIEKRPVDITRHLHELHALYTARLKTLGKENITLILHPVPDGLILETDEVRFRQILGNLLENAMKFTASGMIEIRMEAEPGFLRFSVADTGRGIPEDFRNRIFDRFSKSGSVANSALTGTGLGLAISRNLVELMGGRIWFDSIEEKGTTFFFTLPCRKSFRDFVKEVNDFQSSPKPKRILIVEDDQPSMVLLSMILEEENITYETASSCREALDQLRREHFDIILLDIQLPDCSGLSLVSEARRINENMVVIAQSAYAMSQDIQRCRDEGCNDFISKPILPGVLLKILHPYLKQ